MTKLSEQTYEPTFEISENFVANIGDKKFGQRVKFLINFEVIDKTKNYTVVRVHSAIMTTNRRIF